MISLIVRVVNTTSTCSKKIKRPDTELYANQAIQPI